MPAVAPAALDPDGGHHLQHDEVVRVETSGGGGYGDPRRRDARKVFAEVRDGLLSPEKARTSYGVAVLPDLSGIDEAETARLRAHA